MVDHVVGKVVLHYGQAVEKMTASIGRDQLGLACRFIFVLVLLPYYLNSAMTKVDGFGLSAGAFAQILPPIAEQYLYDTTAIPFFPWHIVVWAGTIAEFVLPVLIVVGFLTRLSALGMIGFIIVQTVVDVVFHGAALGALANGLPGELIDQRLMWVFLLCLLVFSGSGRTSVDHLLRRSAS